ncbi:MAG: RNA-binding protein [Candidatus Thermoplasmatota archaeon]|nr:RNA-binding protein [Candidatus Thermoplasmatota archaeon]
MASKVRNRHRLRKKETSDVAERLRISLPLEFNPECIETANVDGHEVMLIEGKVYAFELDGQLIPSLRALLSSPPKGRHVTVDMGAVKFVANGADIMAPGVVDADSIIQKDMLVWVKDEKNNRPLAVGRALMSGPEMVQSTSGKAVKTMHYVGDAYWELQL